MRTRPRVAICASACFGLIAEEVEEISPHLVIHGRDGQPNSVRYDAINAMSLNEFLKEPARTAAYKLKALTILGGFPEQYFDLCGNLGLAIP